MTTKYIPKRRPPTHGIACKPELWDRLRAYGARPEVERSPNWLAVRAITEYLDRHDGKATVPGTGDTP